LDTGIYIYDRTIAPTDFIMQAASINKPSKACLLESLLGQQNSAWL